MRTLLFALHIIITLGLIGCILLQRSDSGLTSASSGGPRTRTNGLIRLTSILGVIFVVNCLFLTGWIKWELKQENKQLQRQQRA